MERRPSSLPMQAVARDVSELDVLVPGDLPIVGTVEMHRHLRRWAETTSTPVVRDIHAAG